jgi:hypothetical protein
MTIQTNIVSSKINQRYNKLSSALSSNKISDATYIIEVCKLDEERKKIENYKQFQRKLNGGS